jgi:CcmD family protein
VWRSYKFRLNKFEETVNWQVKSLPQGRKDFLMGTFMTAYLAVWLAVVLYVGRLGVRQRGLQQTLDALQERMRRDADHYEPPAKSA